MVILTNEELVADYKGGNIKAFEELLHLNNGLIHTLIKRWWISATINNISYEELEAECVFAFYLACVKYSPLCKCQFSTFAFRTMQWNLIKFFDDTVCKDAQGQSIVFCSLSDIIPGTDGVTYSETIVDHAAEERFIHIDNKLDNNSLKELLLNYLETVCSEREKEVITKRYGIDCKQESVGSIAASFGVSKSRISAIEKAALKKLKESPLKTDFFGEYGCNVKEKNQSPKVIERIDSYEDAIQSLLLM